MGRNSNDLLLNIH